MKIPSPGGKVDFVLVLYGQGQKTDEERRQLKVCKKSVSAYKSPLFLPHSSSVTAVAVTASPPGEAMRLWRINNKLNNLLRNSKPRGYLFAAARLSYYFSDNCLKTSISVRLSVIGVMET